MPDLTLSANIDGFLAETGALHIANGISDATPLLSIDTNSRQLYASDGVTATVYWWDGGLSDTSNVPAANWMSRYLYDSSGYSSVDWSSRYLYDYNGYYSVDWNSRYLYDGSGYYSVDWNYRYLYDYNGYTSVDWSSRILYDPFSNIAFDWYNRYLHDNSGNAILDWGNSSSLGLVAFNNIDASGYTSSSGGAAYFPFGLDASSYSVTASDGKFLTITDATASGPPAFTYGATLTPTAVASLVGNEGTIAYVNDADTPAIGSAVVGSGAAKCLVCYNGTSWIVTSLL